MNQRRNNLGTCFPGYRYCGPWCSGPGSPTNAVDQCCLEHDECYRKYGRSNYCDQKFHRCLSPYYNYRNKLGRDARLFSKAIQFRNFLF
ncbi:Parvovirus coat protein VP1-like protein [Ureibacillus manganicus]|uniref:Parvovirus coat protein VP1-like protein n=1 Tax=Ureibacillus manganicus TaxID=1266064 RepID=UPI0009DE9420|nr:Parvovirus coat protein VP1-like protein [Ureibacillus manganicus]